MRSSLRSLLFRKSLPAGYDYYVAPWGNDTNSGTMISPFATPSRMQTVVNALANGLTRNLYAAAGRYTSGFYFVPTNTLTLNLTLARGVTVDVSQGDGTQPGVGTGATSALNATLNGGTFKGNCRNSCNGISATNTGIVVVNGGGATFTGFDDGVSGHVSSQITANDCGFYGAVDLDNVASKAAFAFVNAAAFTANRCTFQSSPAGGSGRQLLIGDMQDTSTVAWTDCIAIPTIAGDNAGLRRGTALRCTLGTLATRMATTGTNGGTAPYDGMTFTDCFLNTAFDGTGAATTFNGCYGLMSMRARGAATVADLVMRKCIWGGRPPGITTDFHYGNSDPNDGTFDGIGYDIRDCIFVNYAGTVVGTGFSANQITKFNTNSKVYYSCMFGNGGTFAATVTGSDTTGRITTNPLVGPMNTTVKTDWAVQGGSPCIGAGFGGGTIGF